MTDRELLEAAAKAAGVVVYPWPEEDPVRLNLMGGMEWNPLTDDGDALRLAVKLGMEVSCDDKDKAVVGWPDPSHPGSNEDGCIFYSHTTEPKADDPCAATRRAIVRAAVAIGESMQ